MMGNIRKLSGNFRIFSFFREMVFGGLLEKIGDFWRIIEKFGEFWRKMEKFGEKK